VRLFRVVFLVTDVGFIAYWLITLLHIVPPEYLFNDYNDPLMTAWNWSFLPLDLMISATGLTALLRERRGKPFRDLAYISLALTFASGLNAIAFWVIRRDFNLGWWTPNLYLMISPVVLFVILQRPPTEKKSPRDQPVPSVDGAERRGSGDVNLVGAGAGREHQPPPV
jgi:hypothetical protein